MSSDDFDARWCAFEPAEALMWLRTQYGRVDVQADTGSIAERAAGEDGFALRRLAGNSRAEVVYGDLRRSDDVDRRSRVPPP
jgi:hypothetical protein